MDWISTNQASAGVDRNRHHFDKRPRPPAVSEAEREARKKKGVCYNCGNKGHLARNCYYGRPASKG